MAYNNDFFDAMVNSCFASTHNPYIKYFSLKENDAYINNIDRIICNPPATIIIWKNGNKSIVKCMDTDIYNPEQGIAMCLLKQMLSADAYRELKKIMEKKTEEHNC